MKNFSLPSLTVACLTLIFTLGACANHPVADNRHGGNPASANASGVIPTRDGRNSQYLAGGVTGGANGSEYSVPTGSNIPQRYNRSGYTTDTPDPSYVYDQNDVRVQSTNSVGDQLRSVPGVNVNGPR